ncbi:MAG: non-canonical purine NTP pyrophosphatase [Candidatus Nanoarchaeia archaeon]|jgi:non-canonical purine NTP pyrophosphatase (RdgB/HAM1 family)
MIYFITGNKDKFEEASALIPDLKQLDIDLPEIQEMDSKMIIEAKLSEALKHYSGEFIVDDTSVYLDCLNGLPGPLIKWFLKALGRQGIYDLCNKLGNYQATAKTIVGYTDGKDIKFFEGELSGIVVPPVGDHFGWDPIFKPDGYDKTLSLMSVDERNKIKMRGQALRKFNQFYKNKALSNH